MPEEINDLGKGALPDKLDSRDFLFSSVVGAPTVDFTQEFRLSEPPNENQRSSSSCVSHAWSYYHWQLKRKDYSRKDVYSQIFISPSGGAYLRDGGKIMTSKGQQLRSECPDPSLPTESTMRVRCANPDLALDDIEANYFLATDNIDTIGLCVRDYKGAVFGIFGNNSGWVDKTNPNPGGESTWAHALYAFGYHMHNGMKCIIAKSSWCSGTHHEHHIKQDYFNSGKVFNAWVLVPKEELPMNQSKVVLGKDGRTVFIATPIAMSFEEFKKQASVEGIVVPDPIPPSSSL